MLVWGICGNAGVLILIILEYIYIDGNEIRTMELEERLNPYYTGIHLHKLFEQICLQHKQSLNPYYTGIHLHILIIRLL